MVAFSFLALVVASVFMLSILPGSQLTEPVFVLLASGLSYTHLPAIAFLLLPVCNYGLLMALRRIDPEPPWQGFGRLLFLVSLFCTGLSCFLVVFMMYTQGGVSY